MLTKEASIIREDGLQIHFGESGHILRSSPKGSYEQDDKF